MIAAGKRNKNSENGAFLSTQTISVVISPKGLHAPPALAATTIFMADGTRKSLFFASMVISTVESISAVVRLSAIGEIKNAKSPVIQKSFL